SLVVFHGSTNKVYFVRLLVFTVEKSRLAIDPSEERLAFVKIRHQECQSLVLRIRFKYSSDLLLSHFIFSESREVEHRSWIRSLAHW
ncbi:hypothetical protein PFISCL1PPCAC_11178, partial [Pristionchus fissidentatus]